MPFSRFMQRRENAPRWRGHPLPMVSAIVFKACASRAAFHVKSQSLWRGGRTRRGGKGNWELYFCHCGTEIQKQGHGRRKAYHVIKRRGITMIRSPRSIIYGNSVLHTLGCWNVLIYLCSRQTLMFYPFHVRLHWVGYYLGFRTSSPRTSVKSQNESL